jgi:hypothetical protein
MKLPEHVAFSFLLAQFGVQQEYGWPGTALVIAAGCLPDLDGIGIIGGWRFYRKYHRILGHGLPMILLGPLAPAGLGSWLFQLPVLPIWAWSQVSLLMHLLTDLSFYNWPVQLAWPISKRGWALGLLSWNDLVPTLLFYGGAGLVLVMPKIGMWIALVSILATAIYVGWRAFRSDRESAWQSWLAGGWTERSPRFWRWLTGDFVT